VVHYYDTVFFGRLQVIGRKIQTRLYRRARFQGNGARRMQLKQLEMGKPALYPFGLFARIAGVLCFIPQQNTLAKGR
jgi:hypothetical protein